MKVKQVMVVLCIVIALLLVIIIGMSIKKQKEEQKSQSPIVGMVGENKIEEFVEVQEDGSKINTSKELSKTKKIEGLEISNIRLVENNNVSQILADVKNPTNKTLGDFAINIIAIDKNGNKIVRIGGYIDRVSAGETVQLNASATVDFANAYDFKVEKE